MTVLGPFTLDQLAELDDGTLAELVARATPPADERSRVWSLDTDRGGG